MNNKEIVPPEQPVIESIKGVSDLITELVKKIPETDDVTKKRIAQKAMGIIMQKTMTENKRKGINGVTRLDIQRAINTAIDFTHDGKADHAQQIRENTTKQLEFIFEDPDDDLSATG